MSGSLIKLPTLKQIIAGLLATLMMFSAMITEGKFGKIEVELVTKTVTTESEEIELEIKNYSLKSISYGEDFTLEKQSGEKWEKVPVPDGFVDSAAVQKGLTSCKETIDFERSFGKKLDAGEYRLTKVISGESYVVAFTVVEAASAEEATTLPA